MGFLLIVAGVCTNILEGMLVKLNGKRCSKGGFFFNGILALMSTVFFVVTDRDGFRFPPELWLFGLLGAVCFCTALIFTYYSLNIGSFAISMLILAYAVVLPIGYGVLFLHDPVTPITVIGLLLIALSVFLTRGDTKTAESKFSFRWLIFVLIAAITAGMFSVVQKMQQVHFDNAVNNEFMIVTLGLSAAFLIVFGLFSGEIQNFKKESILYAVGAGVVNGITNTLALLVNNMIVLSLASSIRTGVKIVISFIVSLVFYKEKFLKRQIFGVILGTVALILLTV